jgi:hypothetical protein
MDYEYKLRKEDFIPIVGLFKHHKRSVNEMFRKRLVGNDEYIAQAVGRDGLLAIYNLAIGAGIISAATGLASLISK